MSDLAYSIQEWKASFEQAEIYDFKDGPALRDWPLAQFMCGTLNTIEVVKREPLIMQGAINMLESEGFEEFSPQFFATVLGTYKGETTDDFQELAAEWVSENLSPMEDGHPDPENFSVPGDWEGWYRDNAMRSTEAYGEIDAGGKLFWFDRGATW